MDWPSKVWSVDRRACGRPVTCCCRRRRLRLCWLQSSPQFSTLCLHHPATWRGGATSYVPSTVAHKFAAKANQSKNPAQERILHKKNSECQWHVMAHVSDRHVSHRHTPHVEVGDAALFEMPCDSKPDRKACNRERNPKFARRNCSYNTPIFFATRKTSKQPHNPNSAKLMKAKPAQNSLHAILAFT